MHSHLYLRLVTSGKANLCMNYKLNLVLVSHILHKIISNTSLNNLKECLIHC